MGSLVLEVLTKEFFLLIEAFAHVQRLSQASVLGGSCGQRDGLQSGSEALRIL